MGAVRKTEEHMKGMVSPGTLFEELGFYYIGPIDGHDIERLTHDLNNLKDIPGPKLLHIITQKGKGLSPLKPTRSAIMPSTKLSSKPKPPAAHR